MKKILLLLLALICVSLCALCEENDGFTVAADNGRLRMLFNEETLEMRIEDLVQGCSYTTKVMDGKNGNKTTKNNQKSDLRVYYVTNEFVGTTGSMDSNSMSVEYKNFAFSYLENGVEIAYSIGDMTITMDDLPKMVPLDKYYDLLLPYWTERDDSAFREFYRVYRDTMWVRTDDGNIGKVKLNNLYSLFYEKGQYTREDLAQDNEAYGYTISKINPRVDVKIRFLLDGDELLVQVPCGEISFTDGNPVTRLDVLPYFMSADSSQEGYIFVPDGSGSVINFNNGKLTALSYTQRVYGNDVLMNVNSYTAPYDPIRLPVYGLKTNEGATLAIIEEGASLASVYADISGRSDEFNRVYSYFTLRDLEMLSVIGTASGGSPRYPADVYQGNITVRYKFLYGDDANYAGMARAYREYLLERQMLSLGEIPQEAPLFAEIVGAVRKTKFFAGVPYKSTAVATSIEQSREILDALNKAGVKNPVLLMKGFFEGGVKHESLASMSIEGSTGSKKELKNLAAEAKQLGGSVYMVLNAEKVYTTSNFSKNSQASRRQDDYIASVVTYAEPILAQERGYVDSFYVSPAYLETYAEKLAANLSRNDYGAGAAVDDLGGLLIADYRNKRNISRIHALPAVKNALMSLAGAGNTALSAPNDYALFASNVLYDLPNSDNGHKVSDYAVPFMQMVLDGTGVYCARAWNESAYEGVWRDMNFAIESRSAPHFIFTYQNETVFLHTEDSDSQGLFMTQYRQWLSEVESAYACYNEYWHQVAGAEIVSHEALGELRRVRFSNGVTAYINYSDKPCEIDGVKVPAQDYLLTGVNG